MPGDDAQPTSPQDRLDDSDRATTGATNVLIGSRSPPDWAESTALDYQFEIHTYAMTRSNGGGAVQAVGTRFSTLKGLEKVSRSVCNRRENTGGAATSTVGSGSLAGSTTLGSTDASSGLSGLSRTA